MDLRRIDALVAEHVMGLPLDQTGTQFYKDFGWEADWFEVPHYSSDIAAAWEVVERMRQNGFYAGVKTHLLSDGGWYADFHPADFNTASATVKGPRSDTAPLAICLAALKAKGVSVD